MASVPSAPAVLIVDDDTELSALLVRLLQGEGWVVTTAASGAAGERALATDKPDVVLLDVLLPDANGMDLCRRWHAAQPALGILMLTARGDPIDRILGLELGADDYLAKPFEKRELVARLRRRLAGVVGGSDWIETVRGEGYAFVPRGAGTQGPGA